jgi:hypothetical protein
MIELNNISLYPAVTGERQKGNRYAPGTYSSRKKRSHHALDFIEGHYDCGAIRASTRRQDLGELSLSLSTQCCCVAISPLRETSGLLENWLRLIRDVYRTYKDHLDQIEVTLFCWMIRMLMIKLSTNLHHRTRRCATSNWWS